MSLRLSTEISNAMIESSGYADVPGDVVLETDWLHGNALHSHYLVKGTESKLQQLCNQWLNPHWQEHARMVAATPYVMVSFLNASCHLGECTISEWSGGSCKNMGCSRNVAHDPSGREFGFCKFNLVTVNLFVRGNSDELMLFSPYSFCDDGSAIANYRENFGWNVLYADLDFVSLPSSEDKHKFGFRAAIDVPRLSMEGEHPAEPMLELRAGNASGSNTKAELYFSREAEALTGLSKFLSEQLAQAREHADPRLLYQMSHALTGRMKTLSLRQFRGTTTGKQALVQSLQTVREAATAYHGGGTIRGGQRMDFHPTTEVAGLHFPLRADLGLPESAQVLAGAWTLRDFRYVPDREVWSGLQFL